MSKKSTLSKAIYISAIIALAASFLFVVLEKSQVTNFYTKPVISTQNDTRPVNDVQYTPADPTDNDQINQEKQDGTIAIDPDTPEPTSPINVVLTAANQDTAGGPVVIRVLLTDVSSGSCDIKLQQDSTIKEFTKNVVNAGTYYNCEALDVPVGDLSAGTWALTVTVASGDRSGSASQDVEVRL